MKRRPFACAVLASLLLAACSTRNWYQGVKESGRQQCRQNADSDAVRACLDKLETKSADDYDRYDQIRRAPPVAP